MQPHPYCNTCYNHHKHHFRLFHKQCCTLLPGLCLMTSPSTPIIDSCTREYYCVVERCLPCIAHSLAHPHSIPSLYKRFHKPHHMFTAPFAATSHAVHPVEMMLQSVGAMAGPLLCRPHLYLFWTWLVVRQWQGIDDHTGRYLTQCCRQCGNDTPLNLFVSLWLCSARLQLASRHPACHSRRWRHRVS